MALNSMTGFGKYEARAGSARATATVRALNHRYLEIQLSVNSPFDALESELKKEAQKNFRRGKVSISIFIESADKTPFDVRVSTAMLKKWVSEINSARKKFAVKENISFAEILKMPGVVQTVPLDISAFKAEKKAAMNALKGAITRAVAMKEKEGGEIAKEFSAQLLRLEKILNEIEDIAKDNLKISAQKLAQKMREILASAEIKLDEERILTEAAIYSEKSDISEEISRLRMHIGQFRSIVKGKTPGTGTELDFILQEMHREANTLSAKIRFVSSADRALRLRSEIEKMREQARNIE